jgi:hypothetical protein
MSFRNSILPTRLGYIYDDITQLDLQSGEVSPETAKELTKLLNDAQPRNPEEVMARSVITELCNFDRRKSFRFLICRNASYGPLILWTNSKEITSYFKLYGKVYISWNRSMMKYEATPFVSGKGKKTPRPNILPTDDAAEPQPENLTADTVSV